MISIHLPLSTHYDRQKWIWRVSVLAMAMMSLVSATDAKSAPASPAVPVPHIDFEKVQAVIHERCTVCHSATPSSSLFSVAPAGVMFDTARQIQVMAPRIQAQAVTSQIMPLGNITQMTQEERNLIGAWVNAGAPAR